MFQRHSVNNYKTGDSQQEDVHLLRDKWAWHLLASTRVRGRALAMLTPARRPWPYEKVISKRYMFISVLSYVSVDGCAI